MSSSRRLRSAHITEGVARAPNRSMYYALGYTEADFKNPMVGIANGQSTITPCNSGLQPLADAAALAIKESGGNHQMIGRSEERRVGKACVSTCSSRWSPHQ